MSLRLNRASVIDQVSAVLRQSLAEGLWQDWLPGERRLCDDLHVGRNTLRVALRRLSQEGLVEIIAGQGARVLQARKPHQHKEIHVGLLCPVPLERLRPRQALWVDGLRARLAESGGILRVFHGPQYFRTSPGAALQRLVTQEKCGCWILVLSTKACQQWFDRKAIPCVVAGSCHRGILLPYVDLDYRALCRHAATTLRRKGHQRVAYLTTPPEAAGDALSEDGFLEGIKSLPEGFGEVVRSGAGRDGIVSSVRRLMNRENPPTAILVRESYLYLTVFSTLSRMQRRVPEDVSLISREADTFLTYVVPKPACYVEDSAIYARKLARIVEKLLVDPGARPPPILLLPKLLAGESIASQTVAI